MAGGSSRAPGKRWQHGAVPAPIVLQLLLLLFLLGLCIHNADCFCFLRGRRRPPPPPRQQPAPDTATVTPSTMVRTTRAAARAAATALAASKRAAAAATPAQAPSAKKRGVAASSSTQQTGAAVKTEATISTSNTTPKSKQPELSPANKGSRMVGDRRLLFSLSDTESLVQARLVVRPSKRNRSPYVADIWLMDEQREAICHLPNLDMGGKCVPGVTLLVKAAKDRKGGPVGPDAVSPKYGTPKCEFIAQLVYVDESAYCRDNGDDDNNNNNNNIYPPVWVGAHPALGERIAETWLRENLLEGMPEIVAVRGQVRNPCGADNIRSDFLVTHADGSRRVVEVKTVVDTDYSTAALPNGGDDDLSSSTTQKEKTKKKSPRCLFASDRQPYTRTAIFPWGNSNQKGPDGEKVVSTRAIHHVRELTRIATGELTAATTADDGDDDNGNKERYAATVLLVVIRGDAAAFRPNHEACPSFARYLKEASDRGVQVLAKRVTWTERGECWDDAVLPVEWPAT